MRQRLLAFLAGVALAVGLAGPPAAGAADDTCLSCHEDTPKGGLPAYHMDCRGCHSGGDTHAAAPEKANIGKPVAADCLSCHDKRLRRWNFGDHARARVECSSCHNVHQPRLAAAPNVGTRDMDAVSRKCASCHQDVMARLRLRSHHPVAEGAVSCANCHDPHGDQKTRASRSSDICFTCHQAQRGPWAIEHPPVVEDCTTCHNPHGSPNRRLLTAAPPMLCLQCHSVAANRHAVGASASGRIGGAVFRDCASCHRAIHGSHQDAHFRY